jgi:hypothetical protein
MILHKIQFYIKIAMVMSYGSLFLLFIIFHTFTVLRKIEGWKILRFWLSGGRAGRLGQRGERPSVQLLLIFCSLHRQFSVCCSCQLEGKPRDKKVLESRSIFSLKNSQKFFRFLSK